VSAESGKKISGIGNQPEFGPTYTALQFILMLSPFIEKGEQG
jgi:hypothetical protein